VILAAEYGTISIVSDVLTNVCLDRASVEELGRIRARMPTPKIFG
jgi:hypothetical protein